MALYLCLNQDGSSAVTDKNPISTKHTNAGDPKIVEVYVANDGKRKGVENDSMETPLIYTNIEIKVEGVAHKLDQPIAASQSAVNLVFDSIEGWNIGTIISEGTERMKITAILTNTSVKVQRGYSADGSTSVITPHSRGASFVAESTSVELALPDPLDSSRHGNFEAAGGSLKKGLDPSSLTRKLTDREDDNIVRSNKADLYYVDSLIKIDDEIMKITAIQGSEITVLRGCEGTTRAIHNVDSIIYCVGIVNTPNGHKFFIRNSPPKGLPTQKKSDVKIVLMSDEEPR